MRYIRSEGLCAIAMKRENSYHVSLLLYML